MIRSGQDFDFVRNAHDKPSLRRFKALSCSTGPKPSRPRLRWPTASTDDEFKSRQSGIRSFGSGVFQCIRNQVTHNLADITEQAALEGLTAMSLWCRWVEECSLEGACSCRHR
ncbi:TIGR02391 family protein [Amycolatopsis sp. NPDC088138]|uniref:TIGR02391 family protein n=1 Tax=Amycolatopsis sp. NPDC088138 TaxID=3363938 RepID=UPI00381036B4